MPRLGSTEGRAINTPNTMAETSSSTSLPPREAVADALYRCVRGVDSNDRELFESSCLKDDSMTINTISTGPFKIEGWAKINKFFDKAFELVTTHITSNIQVELKDERTASMTCHMLAFHIRPEEAMKPEDTSYTAACLYDIDLVKADDGLWKIKTWDIKVLWTTGDRAIIHG